MAAVGWLVAQRDLQTKIGWPTHYLQNGGMLGFFAVVALTWLGFRQLSKTADQNPPAQTQLLLGLALVGMAMVLLQWLPESTSGIQLLPRSPAAYAGLIASAVATIVWLLIVASFAAHHSGDLNATAVMFILAILLNACLSWSIISSDSRATVAEAEVNRPSPVQPTLPEESPRPPSDSEQILRTWKGNVQKMKTLLVQLHDDRRLVTQMINALDDAPSDIVERTRSQLHQEAADLDHHISRITTEIHLIESTIAQTESSLRQIQRQGPLRQILSELDTDFGGLSETQRRMADLADRVQ